MLKYTSSVICGCGARYERAEAQLPIKDIGVFECLHCGVVLEHWHGRVVPHFREVAAPQTQSRKAG